MLCGQAGRGGALGHPGLPELAWQRRNGLLSPGKETGDLDAPISGAVQWATSKEGRTPAAEEGSVSD